MKKKLFNPAFILIFCGLGMGLGGCASDKPKQENVGKITDEIVRNDQPATRRSAVISAQERRRDKDEFIMRAQKRLNDLASDISHLRNRVAEKLAQADAERADTEPLISLEEVGDQIDHLRTELDQLRESQMANWSKLKEQFQTALNALEAEYFEAKSKIH